jgi:hypothetical protein
MESPGRIATVQGARAFVAGVRLLPAPETHHYEALSREVPSVAQQLTALNPQITQQNDYIGASIQVHRLPLEKQKAQQVRWASLASGLLGFRTAQQAPYEPPCLPALKLAPHKWQCWKCFYDRARFLPLPS